MKSIFSILLCILLTSCMTEEKARPRDSREPMPILDPAKDQKDRLEKIDRSRKAGELGLRLVSESCKKFTINPLEIAANELSGCKETYLLRLRFNCKFNVGMPEPLMRPLRHKEIELHVASPSEPLNQLFPKKLFTDSDGVAETSFELSDLPGSFKFAIKRNGQSHEIVDAHDPIVLPESLCADKKQ